MLKEHGICAELPELYEKLLIDIPGQIINMKLGDKFNQ